MSNSAAESAQPEKLPPKKTKRAYKSKSNAALDHVLSIQDVAKLGPPLKKGRPSLKNPKYKPENPAKLLEMMSRGYTMLAACAQFGIAEVTIYEWIKKYPDFAAAAKQGKLAQHAFWQNVGMANIGNQQFREKVFGLFAKNVMGWTEKQEIDLDARVDSQISVTFNEILGENGDE
jgi:hypothetical protein